MKTVIKKLYEVKKQEIFEFAKPNTTVLGKLIRVFGNKYNVLSLVSFELSTVDFNTDVKVIGELTKKMFSKSTVNARFDQLFGEAVSGLQEYYDELEDPVIVAGIKEHVENIDTGNDQSDYEAIKCKVEGLVQSWIIDKRFI
jgi:hypothetical protein